MIGVASGEGLCVLTIEREDKANSLTKDMLLDLAKAVEHASADPSVHALVLTGKGKVFSAGADLEAARAGLATDPCWEHLSHAIAESPILTIAALNGTAAGGALGMVLAADIRIAHPSASLFYPVMRLGFLPQPSDPKRLAALVGPARAKLLLMGGAKIDAEEACRIGLVDQIADAPLEAARTLATDAIGAERTHVTTIKKMI